MTKEDATGLVWSSSVWMVVKDTFVWWLLIESFVLLLDKILRNGIARSTLCFFFPWL